MEFFVREWHFWRSPPQLPDTADQSEAAANENITPDLTTVPAMQRRRLSPLTKIAFDVALRSDCDPDTQLVFASRHGDLHKTLELLQQIVAADDLSPTQFALSVHNAIAGQFSIFRQHRTAHTSVAAGDASLHYALVEACALLQQENCQQVLVVYADQPVPAVYQQFCQQPAFSHGLALLLSRVAGRACRLQMSNDAGGAVGADEAIQLYQGLQTNQRSFGITTTGRRWSWELGDYVR